MNEFNNIANGLLINSQINLNPKVSFDTLAQLIDLGTNNVLAYTYYNNMHVYCAENDTWYIWKEKGAEAGIIAPDFTYPANYVSFGIDYSNKKYNFFTTVNAPMVWKGEWGGGEYNPNEVVRDGEWTMISLATTEDRPAPQPVGEPQDSLNKAVAFTTGSDASIIKMIHRYTLVENGFLELLEVHTPFWDLDSVVLITIINETSGAVRTITNPILATDDWTVLLRESIIGVAGTIFRVEYEYYNADSANNINGGWTSNEGTGEPAVSEINIDNLSAPTVVEIHHTDLDAFSKQVQLDGVAVGSIIRVTETGDPSRTFEAEVSVVDVSAANSTKYTIINVSNGPSNVRDNRVCTVNIDVPIVVNSEYSRLAAHYPANLPNWATVETSLYFDGVLQPLLSNTEAYGINVVFQKAVISPDWDIVSISAISASSSSSISSFAKMIGTLAYSDLNTTPFLVVGGAGPTKLTNDGLGAQTNLLYPATGITKIWDVVTNQLYFNELSLGSAISYRIDLTITTTAANQEIDLTISAGIGGFTYIVSILHTYYKSAGTYPLVTSSFIYMGDNNTRNNPAEFKIESAQDVTVKVNGFAFVQGIH